MATSPRGAHKGGVPKMLLRKGWEGNFSVYSIFRFL
jgi:hypothetical protein